MFIALLKRFADVLVLIGDFTLFSASVLRGVPRLAGRGTYLPIFYSLGVNSVLVVCVTGLFIGMVLAVESYDQFHKYGAATRLGAMINISVVRQLGPVLVGAILAGRVGGAMAAELATMRITDQVEALSCLGVNPTQYLATPRFLACVLLIPLLTIFANSVGVLGGSWVCVFMFNIDHHHYWENTIGSVRLFDITAGLIKPIAFGATIALISCHRGLNSEAGAVGVGKSATSAFVWAFVAILAMNLFLALLFNQIDAYFWPDSKGMM